MDDSAAALASRLLPGITIIHWEEGNGAVPDDSFFLDLAKRLGTQADVEFFRIRTATTDEWGTPLWAMMVTDYSTCTKFGGGGLVSAWAAWSEFQKHHQQRYAVAVVEAMNEIERTLLEGDCVCGGKEDVLRELRLFTKRLPKDELVLPVKARIEAVEKGTVRIRYKCRPS